MSDAWNAARVLALAPDPASAKAGQGLTSAKNWGNLGRGDGLIWGECQGSGKVPYQTKVEPDAPAFSCSCPSRKFPCKHALGLMLLWASRADAIAEQSPPDWVASWKESREKKAEAKKEKAESPPAPVNLAAQAKREAARSEKVGAGLDDLGLWLSDLLRQGFTGLSAKPGNTWDTQARRMIDAQAPGVARRLRQIGEMTLAGDGWQEALLDRLSRLHLLSEGFRRRDALPNEVAEDVRSAIGFPADLDAVRSGPAIRDRWQVLGQVFDAEDNLGVRRTWLLGIETHRPALLLDFSAGGRAIEPGLPPGFVIDADLTFFPGPVPLRALVKERHDAPLPLERSSGAKSIAEAFADFGDSLAKSPWLELFPIALADVVLQEQDGAWSVRDASGAVLPLANRSFQGWHVLALGGGGAFSIAGEFDGSELNASGCVIGGKFLPLITTQSDMLADWPGAATAAFPLLTEATVSAVVGVDRKPPPSVGEPFAKALPGLETRDAPSRLMAIAAAAGLYGRVGRKPAIDPNPAPETCPPEVQPECSEAAANMLRRMLGGEFVEELREWIELLSDSGRRLPHDAIVDVFDRQIRYPSSVETLTQVLGTRGRWLAARNPSWNKFAGLDREADPATAWDTGTRHERIAILQRLRESDPVKARELLASTFAKESADDRFAFLPLLRGGLSPVDEPFLEAALDDRSKVVRSYAAGLLAELPESRLCRRMIERTRAILSWKPGLLGLGRGTLVVSPPTACDKAMVRDGVNLKVPPGTKLGERAIWLRDVLAATPPAAVSAMLGVSAANIVESSAGSEWREALIEGWTTATVQNRDRPWADALVDVTLEEKAPESFANLTRRLFSCLSPGRRNAIFLRLLRSTSHPLFSTSHPATNFFVFMKPPMDPAVGREILGRVRKLLDAEREELSAPERRSASTVRSQDGAVYDARYHDYSAGDRMKKILGRSLPFDMIEEASSGFELGGDPPLFYASSYAKMLELLRFRSDMHREFAS